MKLIRFFCKNKSVLLFMVVMLFTTIFQSTIIVKAETMDELAMPLSTFETFTKEMAKKETQYYKIQIVKNGTLRLQTSGFHGDIDFYGLDGSDVLSASTSGGRYDNKTHLNTGIYYIRLSNGDADDVKYTVTTSFTADTKTSTEITITLKPGKGIQLGSVISPKEKTVWKTSKSDIAIVSDSGYVKAKKTGTCYIYATAKDSGTTDKIKVIVKK